MQNLTGKGQTHSPGKADVMKNKTQFINFTGNVKLNKLFFLQSCYTFNMHTF